MLNVFIVDLLFILQGSLYEQDKVSFIHTWRVKDVETVDSCKTESDRLFYLVKRNLVIVLCLVASESHREVHASLGVPSQQGVCQLTELQKENSLTIK